MSLDQIFMLLTDKSNLHGIANNAQNTSPQAVALTADSNGNIPGVSRDGLPMKAKIMGTSLASRIREKHEKERLEKEQAEKSSRKRRGRRKK